MRVLNRLDISGSFGLGSSVKDQFVIGSPDKENSDISTDSLNVWANTDFKNNVTLGSNNTDIISVSGTLINFGGANLTGSFSGSGAKLSDITASNITNFNSSVRDVFLPGDNITINQVGSKYVISSSAAGPGGTIYVGGNITGSGTSGDPLGTNVNSSFQTLTASVGVSASYFYGDGSGLTNVQQDLSGYATLIGVSASFATPSQVSGAITSSLTDYPIRTEVSGAITGALTPYLTTATAASTYATLSGVTASFTTPTQVSGAITSSISDFPIRTEVTGALSPYALSSDVSSSFGLKTDLTASYARLGSVNTFTAASNIFNNDVIINGTASIGLLSTLNQQSLLIGDKYITILSGSNTHVQMDGAGILFGSGSSDITTGDQGSVAYIVYRKGNAPTDFTSDYIEIFPGLKVSGSLTASAPSTFTQVTASVGFSGDGSKLTNIPSTAIDLSAYAKSADVSSSFGLKTDLTASYARLASSNIFSANQTVTGSVFISSVVSASQFTGSYSGGSFSGTTINGTQITASTGFSGGTIAGTTISGSSTLQAGGQSTFGAGIKIPYAAKTGNYSLTASSDYVISFSGSNLTGTLPSAANIQGSVLVCKNLHTSSLYITASGGTIDGSTTGITIYNQYTSLTFISDNTNWLIV